MTHPNGHGGSPRSAVVVGGASGIGAAIARAFVNDGAAVTVADRNVDQAALVAAGLGPGHDARGVDVADEDSVRRLFEGVRADRGGVDAAINCAGITVLAGVTELAAEKFRRVVDVCLTGGFVVIKHAGRVMDEGGSIVSLSSLNARQAGIGMAAYCSAKAGLSMLTQVAALELAPRGIRVNAVAPGLVLTPLTSPAMQVPGIEDDYLDNIPLGRSGAPEEIADAVRYVSRARWLTGEILDINGGAHLMRYPDLVAHYRAAAD